MVYCYMAVMAALGTMITGGSGSILKISTSAYFFNLAALLGAYICRVLIITWQNARVVIVWESNQSIAKQNCVQCIYNSTAALSGVLTPLANIISKSAQYIFTQQLYSDSCLPDTFRCRLFCSCDGFLLSSAVYHWRKNPR